jgi:phosphatidylglycerophosphatase A
MTHLQKILGWISLFFSSICFTGFLPGLIHHRLKGKGGGLMGSTIALIVLIACWKSGWCNTVILSVIALALFIVGIPMITSSESLMRSYWGDRKRHTGEFVRFDYNETCYDEVVGMFWMAVIVWPFRLYDGHLNSYWPILAGFILFRFLDTTKPWPISTVEKKLAQTNISLSVMMDDVIAGIMAGLLTIISILIGKLTVIQ